MDVAGFGEIGVGFGGGWIEDWARISGGILSFSERKTLKRKLYRNKYDVQYSLLDLVSIERDVNEARFAIKSLPVGWQARTTEAYCKVPSSRWKIRLLVPKDEPYLYKLRVIILASREEALRGI